MRRLLLIGALVAVSVVPAALARGGSKTGDRNLRAALVFIDARCPPLEREISRSMWEKGERFNALYGNCRAGDGRDQRIWFFSGGRFIGRDTKDSSREVIGLWRDTNTIAFLYVLYRRNDPNCCPTGGGRIVRFRLNGRRVRARDPIPRGR